MLIEHGATLNEPKDKYSASPFIEFLSNASDYNHAGSDEQEKGKAALKLFDLMLKHGLSIDDHCGGGGNAYWHAYGHQALRDRLAAMGCDTLVASTYAYTQGETLQNLRVAIDRRDSVRFLQEMAGFHRLSQKDKDDLLWDAIFNNRRDYIVALVENGAEPNSLSHREVPLYRYFAESYPDDVALITLLKERAAADIARQEERQQRALEDYLSYENWYATLEDFKEDYEKGASYYSKALYSHAVKNRAIDYFNILKHAVTDTAHQPEIERTRDERRFRIIRPYTGLSGRHNEATFEMVEQGGRFIVDKIELYK